MKKFYFIFLIFFLVACVSDEQTEPLIHTQELPSDTTIETWEILQSSGVELLTSTMTWVIDNSGTTQITHSWLENTQTDSGKILESEKIDILDAQESDDESITKYVNDKIHYTKINYVPKNLLRIQSDYVYDTKGNQVLREETNEALQQLAKDFYQEFQIKLKVVSAYRSYNYQVWIKKWGCSDLFCAKAWYSEHQSGLAFDMFETTSKDEFLSKPDLKKYYEWMEKNAYKYGFNNSYKNGKEIDGYAIEPWHWRYVGVDFAQELWEKDMTYGAYVKKYWQK